MSKATPTVVIGITSTPRAQSKSLKKTQPEPRTITNTYKPTAVQTTVVQTQTLIIVAQTVTANCGNGNGGTRTVTNFQQGQTVTRTSTILRTLTDGQQTSYWTTTATATASCHDQSTQTNFDNNPVASAQPSWCVGDNCRPYWSRGTGWGWRGRGGNRPRLDGDVMQERTVAGSAAVAAVTSTYTETTYTVTRTVVTTIPPKTTTELGKFQKFAPNIQRSLY